MRRPEPIAVTPAELRSWPLPAAGSDKEAHGRVLVVGGSDQTPAAVVLAAEAELRCGAGELQVATARSVARQLAVALPESRVVPLAEVSYGSIGPDAGDTVADLASRCDAVLIGPGLRDVEAAVALLGSTAPRLGVDDDEVDGDPAAAVRQLADSASAVVCGGGRTSWIAEPGGRVWRGDAGGPGLGVSGSGDVKAGMVAGLVARGAEPAQAAVWAEHLHGTAGDRLAVSVGPLGFLARELPAQVPLVMAELEA